MSPTEKISWLKKLYQLSMTLSGDPMDIFVHVARMIGALLDVKVVCLSEIRGRELYFLSVYDRGRIFLNAGNCPLEITPCATVEASQDIQIYDRVRDRFPRATFLKEHNAYSYCGFPSLDNNGKVVAVTCLLDDRPHEFTKDDQEILRIFGQRIGLEIERKHLDDERQAALSALKDNEERLRLITESIAEVFWMTDLSVERMYYVSPSYERVWKRPCKDLYENPRSFLEAVHPDDRARVVADFAVQQKGEPFDYEYRIIWPDGMVRWIWDRGFPVRDATGSVTRYVGIAQDITKRKQAEKSLRESEQRLELALMGAHLGLWDWNVETGHVFFNDRWANMLGYTLAEIQPHYDGWARLVHPDDMPHVREVLDAHLQEKTPFYEVEHRLLTKAGEWKWVLSHGKVFERDKHGKALRAAGIHMDISKRKELEERLGEQQEQLCHAQRLTTAGELAATMAHELNQPLAAITNYLGAAALGFSDLLAAQPALQEMMDDVLRLSRRAADVVRGIRDLVRKQESKPEWVSFHVIVDEILSLVRTELTRKQIRLVLKIPATLPRIWGHRVHLQQLLLNLILNAMDAMNAPELSRRTLTVRADLNHGDEIAISVSDTGPGIAPEIATRLFEPFVTTKPQGIGLGLPVCRTIAETHGGRISAHWVSGKGTTFDVILPMREGAERRDS